VSRAALGRQVFLTFAALSAVTLLAAVAVHLGMQAMARNDELLRIVQEFRVQAQVLELVPADRADAAVARGFESAIREADALIASLDQDQWGLSDALRRDIAGLARSLARYEKAREELAALQREQQRYALTLREPLGPGLLNRDNLAERLARFAGLRLEAHQEHDPQAIRRLRDVARQILERVDTSTGTVIRAAMAAAERDYLNHLAMLERRDFLRDTARHFSTISRHTIVEIQDARLEQDRFVRAVVRGLLLFSVILPIVFWLRTSRYFDRFLAGARFAIQSIRSRQYDYPAPAMPDDELGELGAVLKELALDLKASREFFEATLDHLPTLVFVLDPGGRIEFANRAALGLVGLPLERCRDQPFHRSPWIGDSAENRQVVHELLQRCAAGESGHLEIPLFGATGVIWVDMRVHPIHDQDGRTVFLLPACTDITERRQSERELRLAATAFQTNEGIVILDSRWHIVRVNRALLRMSGYSERELLGRHVLTLQRGGLWGPDIRGVWRTLADAGHWAGELRAIDRARQEFPVWVSITAVQGQSGETSHFVASIVDMSETVRQREMIGRKAVEEETLGVMLRLSLASTAMVDYLTASLELVLERIPALRLLPGGRVYLARDTDRGPLLELVVRHEGAGVTPPSCELVPFGHCLCGEAASEREIRFLDGEAVRARQIHPDPEVGCSHYSVPIIRGDEVLGVVLFYLPFDYRRDPADEAFLRRMADVLSGGIIRRRTEQAMQYQATHDSLTGLPNRHQLMADLRKGLARARRHRYFGALLFVDLDHFKPINDSLGHTVGDQLLEQVAGRLRDELRHEDTASRLGGDEFILLFTDLAGDEETAIAKVQAIAEKLRQALALPYRVGDRELHVTSSMGIAMFPDEKGMAEDLLRKADLAMYRAKEAGRNAVRYFEPAMQELAEHRLGIQGQLATALERAEFRLHYQPQVDREGRIVGAEGLVRWQHPERGLVSPAEFVSVAEDTGQIVAIGDWVVREACERLRDWDPGRLPQLSVNVSSVQFGRTDFVEQLEHHLAETAIDPRRLKLEMTESILLKDFGMARERMLRLAGLGIRLSLDDFGTGYSSLSYLKRLPFSELKIDQSFVSDLPDDVNDAQMVKTIITLARQLGLTVVAEGVETRAQWDFLADAGCQHYQGYHIGRPEPMADFEARIALDRKRA
jgi:diguanylate cyclase (GGDEF)-like protein/PAS domain S-box-containing protein